LVTKSIYAFLTYLSFQSVSALETDIFERVRSRIFRAHLDVLVLMQLRNGCKGCHDIVRFIRSELLVPVGSGAVYSVLYTLEKEGFVKSELRQQKKLFTLTDKGEHMTRRILTSYRSLSDYSAHLIITSLGLEKLS